MTLDPSENWLHDAAASLQLLFVASTLPLLSLADSGLMKGTDLYGASATVSAALTSEGTLTEAPASVNAHQVLSRPVPLCPLKRQKLPVRAYTPVVFLVVRELGAVIDRLSVSAFHWAL